MIERAPIVTAVLLLALLGAAPTPAAAGQVPDGFFEQIVATELRFPVGMAFLPDGRLLVVEREVGVVKLIVPGPPRVVEPVLQVDSIRVDFYEQGLLGIAVDPEWPARPYVYVYYDALDLTMKISRFRASGDLENPLSVDLVLDPASRFDVLSDVPDANESHNGGTLRFGPDGMLYVALADDWAQCAAQDSVSLRGALLRLDVSNLPEGPGGPADKSSIAPADNPWASHSDPDARLVWATGFRNPFRFHIDSVDGAVFITDVGWSSYEEIDRVDMPAQNFGWPFYEGNVRITSSCTPGSGAVFTPPIYVDDRRGHSHAALVSGGVYRPVSCSSCNFSQDYDGDYFYGDFHRGFIRRLKLTEAGWNLAPEVPGQPSTQNWAEGFVGVTDYAIGPDGALWYCRTSQPWLDHTGSIGRIFQYNPGPASVPTRSAGPHFAAPVPSPARERVQFTFTMDRPGSARLEVFDLGGRRLATLLDAARLAAGAHRASWAPGRDARAAAAGVYFARLTADGVTRQRRFVIAR